ncbi:probable galacturonosyltransferase 7 [Cornus florida]|uniref:probable galacturonosyltransferase 7 n=1 Tax=Cornus florida TaxID=4283 RepID=UPI00289D5E8D|nr:probable galacturonosyltransferase 7 [Cornus florida]XP_059631695.1 probable galacturonosyltransferase 7 [Cornus florida]
MKDLLYVARAYFPSIAKLAAHDKLSREMKQNIQEFERILSEATTDKDFLPQFVFTFALGAGLVPSLLLSEIFPNRIRAKAMAIYMAVHWVKARIAGCG